MRAIAAFGLLVGVLVFALPLHAGPGQGTAESGAGIDGLVLGTYWYGAPLDKRDLIGKVVLVEIWGS